MPKWQKSTFLIFHQIWRTSRRRFHVADDEETLALGFSRACPGLSCGFARRANRLKWEDLMGSNFVIDGRNLSTITYWSRQNRLVKKSTNPNQKSPTPFCDLTRSSIFAALVPLGPRATGRVLEPRDRYTLRSKVYLSGFKKSIDFQNRQKSQNCDFEIFRLKKFKINFSYPQRRSDSVADARLKLSFSGKFFDRKFSLCGNFRKILKFPRTFAKRKFVVENLSLNDNLPRIVRGAIRAEKSHMRFFGWEKFENIFKNILTNFLISTFRATARNVEKNPCHKGYFSDPPWGGSAVKNLRFSYEKIFIKIFPSRKFLTEIFESSKFPARKLRENP